MADFENIIKTYATEDGAIPADAIAKLLKAITTAVGNEFVDKARYKAKLDEIDQLKSDKQTAEDNATTAEKWKTKYNALKEDYDNYKTEQTAKATHSSKEAAYKKLLQNAGVSEKRIDAVLKVSDIDSIELDDKGAVKDADKLTNDIKTEWSDFIVTTQQSGANTQNPPANTGGSSMAEIYKKDEKGRYVKSTEERQKALAEIMANKTE